MLPTAVNWCFLVTEVFKQAVQLNVQKVKMMILK
jgi:hypothetical protein